MTEITKDTELTTELLKEFKDQYKKIFKTVLIDGTEIIWRRLSRREYKEIMQEFGDIKETDLRLWTREEKCCQIVVLYPCAEVLNDILEESAGLATVLSDEIYDKSGFRLGGKSEEL